ncbi:MAG: serine/threonine-protein kinase [Phycisphaerae bacterium]|nr:serine/threonine-protein kinase [Phycisphaerae bacterium]
MACERDAGVGWAADGSDGEKMTTRYQAGTRISEYLLEAILGGGAFGEVWRARHHVWHDQEVAIKLPTAPEYVRYLQHEGNVVHKLRHPNIVSVLGLDPYADQPYMIMELVRGPDVAALIRDHPKGLPLALARNVLLGMLRAMRAAHAAGVLHRDLKPSNVMLQLGGRAAATATADDVRVTDFGLASGAGADTLRSLAQSVAIGSAGSDLVGTLAYMAPEVRDGQRPHDAKSDLYSIGVILFEMLIGERPAGADSPMVLRGEVPVALDRVFRMLYTRHERRPESADAVLRELNSEPLGAIRPGPAAAMRTEQGAPLPPTPSVPGTVASHLRSVRDQKCPLCSHRNEAGSQFCVKCATQLVTVVRRCPKCEAYPGPLDRYCIFCGAALPAAEA